MTFEYEYESLQGKMYVSPYWKDFKPIEFYWHILNGTVVAFISSISLITNLMSLFFFLRVKGFKSGDTYFILNLSIADFFKGAVLAPMNVTASFYGSWMFGQTGCNIYAYGTCFFSFVTINTITFMTIERYFLVKNPFSVLRCQTRLIIGSIILTWIFSAIIIIPFWYTPHQFVLEGFLTSCTIDYIDRSEFTRGSFIQLILLGFIVPYLAIIFFYALLIQQLNPNCHKQKFSVEFRQTFRGKQFRNDIAAAKSALIIIGAFLIAWSPYALVATYAQFGSNIHEYITPYVASLPALFAKLASMFNPALYILTRKECQLFYKNLICGKSKNRQARKHSETELNDNNVETSF